jgi:hypothetical protein
MRAYVGDLGVLVRAATLSFWRGRGILARTDVRGSFDAPLTFFLPVDRFFRTIVWVPRLASHHRRLVYPFRQMRSTTNDAWFRDARAFSSNGLEPARPIAAIRGTSGLPLTAEIKADVRNRR